VRRVVLDSAKRSSDAPDVVADSMPAPAQEVAPAATETASA
jgi:hypothetical protein